MNRFATVLRVVVFFLILTDLTKVFVKFCVIEVFKFWVGSRWMKELGAKRVYGWGCPWNPKAIFKEVPSN